MDYFTFDFSSRRLKRFDYQPQAIDEAEKNPKQTIVIEGKQILPDGFGQHLKSEKVKKRG